HSGRCDHRTIAAEDEYQIRVLGQLFGRHLYYGASRFLLDAIAFDFRSTKQSDTALRKPLCQIAQRLHRIALMRFQNYSNTFDIGSHRCIKTSVKPKLRSGKYTKRDQRSMLTRLI